MINDRVINIPSYTVTTAEENNIQFTPESKFPEILEKSKEEKAKSSPEVEDVSENSGENQTKASSESPATQKEDPSQVTETKSESSSSVNPKKDNQ